MFTVLILFPKTEHDPPESLDCYNPNWKLQLTPAVNVKSAGKTVLK